MQEVHFIESSKEAVELLKPIRISILKKLNKPTTCPEIAKQLGLTTQKVNYHMNLLKDAGMVTLVEERRNRGTVEGYYQAVAKSFWFSPRMVTMVGGQRKLSEQASLVYLLNLAEELQIDIGKLASRESTEPIPTLALDGFVELRNQNEKADFLNEIQESFKKISNKYAAKGSAKNAKVNNFRFITACYPHEH